MKAEAECSKLNDTMEILERKLKQHKDNIQAMKEELLHSEEEKKVNV